MKVAMGCCALFIRTLQKCTIMENDETRQMLADLIWLNALIATELIQITENTSAILRKSAPPESCLQDHNALRSTALEIAQRYKADTALARHLGEHQ
jgi:hypothetical protein